MGCLLGDDEPKVLTGFDPAIHVITKSELRRHRLRAWLYDLACGIALLLFLLACLALAGAF